MSSLCLFFTWSERTLSSDLASCLPVPAHRASWVISHFHIRMSSSTPVPSAFEKRSPALINQLLYGRCESDYLWTLTRGREQDEARERHRASAAVPNYQSSSGCRAMCACEDVIGQLSLQQTVLELRAVQVNSVQAAFNGSTSSLAFCTNALRPHTKNQRCCGCCCQLRAAGASQPSRLAHRSRLAPWFKESYSIQFISIQFKELDFSPLDNSRHIGQLYINTSVRKNKN